MANVLVHGGAGRWRGQDGEAAVAGVRAAARAGAEALAGGGGALDAAVAAVAVMEDDPVFNAGTGAALDLDGRARMDAGVMDGQPLTTGAVALLEGIRSPVTVARAVMERSGHCLLAGDGAGRFARALGFADHDPVTAAARDRWRRRREALAADAGGPDDGLARLLAEHPGDTVGAVVRDDAGRMAVATSTGGTGLKLAGRIGDSPLAGAGFYADRRCAVAATGSGEQMIRFGGARAVAERIRAGQAPQQAVDGVLADMAAQVGEETGLIAVDAVGRAGAGHRTAAMPHALAEGESLTARSAC